MLPHGRTTSGDCRTARHTAPADTVGLSQRARKQCAPEAHGCRRHHTPDDSRTHFGEQFLLMWRESTATVSRCGGIDRPVLRHSTWTMWCLLTPTKKSWQGFSNWRSSLTYQHTRYETSYRPCGLGTSGGTASVRPGPEAESRGASPGGVGTLELSESFTVVEPLEGITGDEMCERKHSSQRGTSAGKFSSQKKPALRLYESEG